MKEDHRSYIRNLCSCKKKAWKKFRLEQDSNPWPLQYRCSALPIKLTSQLGTGRRIGSAVHIYDFNIFIISSSSFHRFVTNRFKHHDRPWFSHVHNFKIIIIIVSSWVSLHKSFEYRRQIFNELTIFNVHALRCEHWFARDCLWIYILFFMLKD